MPHWWERLPEAGYIDTLGEIQRVDAEIVRLAAALQDYKSYRKQLETKITTEARMHWTRAEIKAAKRID